MLTFAQQMAFKAKKSLGQNFLYTKGPIISICDASDIKSSDTVIEAGPGKGILTEELLTRAGKVIVVEKDRLLIPFLEEKFSKEIKSGKLNITEGDILKFEPQEHELKDGEYKIIANIPYYITGAFFEYFLSNKTQPNLISVLIQKEVAERIVRKDKKGSILSVSVDAYGYPKYIKTVKKNLFRPAPKVDSAILAIENISRDKFEKNNVSEKDFFEVLKKGFAHKRKRLMKNLGTDENVFQKLDVPQNIRAEELSTEKWFSLAKDLTTE